MSEITYRQVGDYMIPNIDLAEEDKKPIGKYGMLRRSYLKNHKRVQFNMLLMKGELTKHLLEVQTRAEKMMEQITSQMAQTEGVTEELKANNQLLWVQLMNNIQHSAEEIVMQEVIYS